MHLDSWVFHAALSVRYHRLRKIRQRMQRTIGTQDPLFYMAVECEQRHLDALAALASRIGSGKALDCPRLAQALLQSA